MAGHDQKENAGRRLNKSRGVRLLLIFLLVVSVIVEGYYIYLLQDKIEKRNDELKNISVQLQFLKNEREDLKAALSSAKKTGGAGDGNASDR
ncbi:MAG: hypothetical protein CVV37_06340 [Nitrospira bacterium HGW-Nitrospira-1]|nr:MAG: hypothetical protein CVV37_06340 [Nitrospira bacterium HGW-Nitrospira-1]